MIEPVVINGLSSELASLMTLAELIVYGEQLLSPQSDSAKLDTEILICFVMNKERSFLLTWPENKLSQQQAKHFVELMLRRVAGEPIAYIVNLREFWSLPLQVSPATLIPRPDTEVLVEQVLSQHVNENLTCLDLGTGTGAIALALASEKPLWTIEAIDFNHDAVELATRNAKNLDLSHVDIYQSDWFNSVSADKSFDIIVSNPPYIDAGDHHLDEGDVRYEPKTALVAADSGLADIKIIVNHARKFLKPGGCLYIEHGFEQSLAVKKILADFAYSEIETIKDYSNNDRITYACYSV